MDPILVWIAKILASKSVKIDSDGLVKLVNNFMVSNPPYKFRHPTSSVTYIWLVTWDVQVRSRVGHKDCKLQDAWLMMMMMMSSSSRVLCITRTSQGNSLKLNYSASNLQTRIQFQ